MKSIRKILCACLALVMCLSLSSIVSAAPNHEYDVVMTDDYGRLRGRLYQITNAVDTKTQVDHNNDGAYLQTKILFHTNNSDSRDTIIRTSGRGSTVWNQEFPNYFSTDTYNVAVNGTHEVYGGTDDIPDAAYTFLNLSKPYMK